MRSLEFTPQRPGELGAKTQRAFLQFRSRESIRMRTGPTEPDHRTRPTEPDHRSRLQEDQDLDEFFQ